MAGAANDEEDHRNEPPAKHKHTRNVRIDESINEVVQKEVRRQGGEPPRGVSPPYVLNRFQSIPYLRTR